MNLDLRDFDSIVSDIWGALMGTALAIPSDTDAALWERSLFARVAFRGDWNGCLELDCTRGLAAAVAASFFGVDRSEVRYEDAADAVGELLNTLAGHIRPLLPGTVRVSVPRVVPAWENAGREANALPGVLACRCYADGELFFRVRLRQGSHEQLEARHDRP